MNFLPQAIEDIIVDYKIQLEHRETFQSTLNEINDIIYVINVSDTFRISGDMTTQYYGGLNQAETLYHSINELWVHTYSEDEMVGEIITTIYECSDYVEINVDEEQSESVDVDDLPEDFRYHQ